MRTFLCYCVPLGEQKFVLSEVHLCTVFFHIIFFKEFQGTRYCFVANIEVLPLLSIPVSVYLQFVAPESRTHTYVYYTRIQSRYVARCSSIGFSRQSATLCFLATCMFDLLICNYGRVPVQLIIVLFPLGCKEMQLQVRLNKPMILLYIFKTCFVTVRETLKLRSFQLPQKRTLDR